MRKELSEKGKEKVCAYSALSDSLQPHGLSVSGSSVHGLFQEILEQVAISYSRGSSQPRD